MWIACFALSVACTDPAATPLGVDPDGDDVEVIRIASSVPDLGSFVLPVDGGLPIASTFGPRHLDGEDRDDFHQGIDIPGGIGDPLRAIAAGRVHRVVPTDGAGDGNTLYIEHPVPEFTWHGETLDRIYVQYGHLDTFEVVEDQQVEAGDVVARMGDTSANSVHVHLEIRLGTHCSLRYQVANPTSTCGQGFDPSVHPLHLFRTSDPGELGLAVESTDPLVVTVTAPVDGSDWTRLETDLGVVDFDLKDGIDATSKPAMDDLDLGWVRIEPEPFDRDAQLQTWHLHFEGQPTFVQVTDVYGEGVRMGAMN